MANNVNNYLSVVTVTPEGQKVWDSIIERIDALGDNKHLTGLFYEADAKGYWIVPEGEYAGDKVGAKWAFPLDYDSDGISIESAWGPVIPLAEYIAEEIGKVDPSVQLLMTYEDEMPNFIGVTTFNADGVDIDNSIDYEEVREYLIDKNPELKKLWDEEEEDWTDEDEALEIMSDVQWDLYNAWQDENTEWSTR